MLADAIDIPYVLLYGLVILVPLLLFEVVVEALVLKRIWTIPFSTLCRFTLIANCLSLLAGIPVKFLNAWLYSFLLPDDLPGFFARYPSAVAIGSLIYFTVTVAVEGAYAFRWLRRKQIVIALGKIWTGVFLANLASYIVLAPLHYYITRPIQQVREFLPNTGWSSNAKVNIAFIDAVTGNLKITRVDGTGSETLVPVPLRDYLLSTDLNLSLFRGTNGSLYFYRHNPAQTNMVWQTHEKFLMNQAAFSPSGQYVAFINQESNAVEVVDLQTGSHSSQPILSKLKFMGEVCVAWSTVENIFYVNGLENNECEEFTIEPYGLLGLPTNSKSLPLLTCYGRESYGGWWSTGDDWGPEWNGDSRSNLNISIEHGLGSGLEIYRGDNRSDVVLYLSVNPGLLHISRFDFEDAAFLPNSNECLFQANDYIYVLNIPDKKVGTVAHGVKFILFTPRYQKKF